MNEASITRPEFDRYVQMTAESTKSIAESIAEQAKESAETNLILREYIITNNHKHDQTATEIEHIKEKARKLKDAVEANTQVIKITKPIKWALIIVLTGSLMAYGAHLTSDWINKGDHSD